MDGWTDRGKHAHIMKLKKEQSLRTRQNLTIPTMLNVRGGGGGSKFCPHSTLSFQSILLA